MAELFDCSIDNVSLHLKNIFKEAELSEKSVVEEFSLTATDGKNYSVKHYNLDAIISVAYRVNSMRGTQFRIWATQKLREYIVKGFVLDDERLKNPDLPFDYFEELESTIADIRTSEKRFYRKITDIYATSVDYDPTNDQSIVFFKTVQNKVHYAVTGSTAAEIVASRIDVSKKNLGLTNFRGIKPKKEEVVIAKMKMSDWNEKLHGFLTINDRNILQDAGKISHELMVEIAEKKFDEYKSIEARQDVDFDEIALSAIESVKNSGRVKIINIKKVKLK
ncbi:MAG: hypothetical protein US09_C0005G0050 [Candidatus Moranbacteria bacterium GW2011_GWD1_36_198]|nr:MAG: hypothetical protein US09_C0005G0050 [Candidatus Moranbacteria bacterium GW2011_GWD1_36_198]